MNLVRSQRDHNTYASRADRSAARIMPENEWQASESKSRAPSLASETGAREMTLPRKLNVEVLYVERVVFNKFAARFDVFSHQRGEDLLGLSQVFQLDLQQGASFGIHGGFP